MSYAWSRQHDDTLRCLLAVNADARNIANRLGRTPDDVEGRIRILALERRLANHYGSERARLIMAGRDAAAEADIAAWNRFGVQRGRAA